MLNESEVLALLNAPELKTPDFIKQGRDVYYGMSLHTTGAMPTFTASDGTKINPPGIHGKEYQQLFDFHLMSKHPREAIETRNWRYSQYRPKTKAPFAQIIETISGAIFQDSNYSVTIPNESDSKYIFNNNFSLGANLGFTDLIGYFAGPGLQHIMEDPDGYFIRIPKKPWYETGDEVMPDIWFVGTKDLITVTPEEIIFCRNDYAWVVNPVAIFRYQKNKEGKYEPADQGQGYFAHTFGYLPADIAGGILNTHGFYESWLSKAKPVADEYIPSFSNEQLVDKEASHPFIVQAQMDCPTCNGLGEVSIDNELLPEGIELVTCGKCKGKKTISSNPGDRILVPAEEMKNKQVDIVNPNVDINKYHHDKNKDVYTAILEALHLIKVDAAQSGVAKTIDQERLYQLISKVCNDLWDRIIFNTIRDFIAYRNVKAEGGTIRPLVYEFTFIKPTQFQIKTAADLLADFNAAVAMPTFIRNQALLDYADKQYGGDLVLKKKAKAIIAIDPAVTLTVAERESYAMNSFLLPRQLQFSAQLPMILDRVISAKGAAWFLGAKTEDIESEANTIFDKLRPPTPAIQPPPSAPAAGQ